MAYINGNKSVSVVKTQSVAVDVEANPTGTATETLEKLKVGDTIYSADGGASSPDTEMSDSSVNAVQNKVIKKYVDDKADTKANTDGYYSTLGAGHSDSTSSLDTNVGNDDETPFNYQTAGGSSDITTGIQSLKKLVGVSVVFNQLLNPSELKDSETLNDVSYTCNSSTGLITFSGTPSATGNSQGIWQNGKGNILTIGHKYLFSLPNLPSNLYIRDSYNDGGVYANGSYIFNATNTYLGLTINFGTTDAISYSGYWNIFDLTQMFGSQVADYIYAKEQANAGDGVAIFKSMFPNDYYEYNVGTFIHSKSAKLKMVDYNQWDEEWGNYHWINGVRTTYTNGVGNANPIKVVAGQTYYIQRPSGVNVGYVFLDSNQNLVGGGEQYLISGTNTLTIPSGVSYLCFWLNSYGSTYQNNVCISLYWDGSRIGYEPYQEHIYDLPNDELKGILKVVDNKIVADGDEEYPDGTKKVRYGITKIKDLDFSYDLINGIYTFGSILPLANPTTDNAKISDLFTIHYTTLSPNNLYNHTQDKSISLQGVGTNRVWLYDASITSVADLKSAYGEDYIIYKLAEETETTSTAFAENIYADDFGTMEFLDENNARISGIQGNEIFYKANISGFAESLYVKTDGDVDDIVTQEDIDDTAFATRGYIKLASITGYDATKTQVLKNVNGTFTWVDET